MIVQNVLYVNFIIDTKKFVTFPNNTQLNYNYIEFNSITRKISKNNGKLLIYYIKTLIDTSNPN
jgi:hypothetical protein